MPLQIASATHNALFFGGGWPFAMVVTGMAATPTLATVAGVSANDVKDMTSLFMWIIGSLIAVIGILYARTHQQQAQMITMLKDALSQVAKRDAEITEMVRQTNELTKSGTAAVQAFVLESQTIRRMLYPRMGITYGNQDGGSSVGNGQG